MLRAHLEADHCYVMDRWYAQFTLFNEIMPSAAATSAGCATTAATTCSEERPLSEAAARRGRASGRGRDAGRDRQGRYAARPPDPAGAGRSARRTRRRAAHGGTGRPPSDGVLRIATNLLDVPAEIIADIYRHRWTIELFFRFFKHVLGCRHLLSTIASGYRDPDLLRDHRLPADRLWTGGKPTLRTYEMVCLYLQGWADEEEYWRISKNSNPTPLKPALATDAGSLHAALQPTGADHCAALNIPLLTIDIDITGYITLPAILEPNRRGCVPFSFSCLGSWLFLAPARKTRRRFTW